MKRFMPKTYWTFMICTARPHRHLPAGRLLVQGRDPRRRRAARRPGTRAFLVVGPPRRVHDRRLHDPLRVPHLPRRAPGPRRRHGAPAPRVRAPHRGPALHPHRAGHRRRLRQHPEHAGARLRSPTAPPCASSTTTSRRATTSRARCRPSPTPSSTSASRWSRRRSASPASAWPYRLVLPGPRAPRHHRAQHGSPALGYRVLVEQVLLRLALHRRHRPRRQGPDRPGRLLVQPEGHRRRRQRRRHRRRRRPAGSSTTRSTRASSTPSSTAPAPPPRAAARACARSRPGACSSTPPSSSPPPPCSPASSSSSSKEPGPERDHGQQRLPHRLGPEPHGVPAAGGGARDDADPQGARSSCSRSSPSAPRLASAARRRRGDGRLRLRPRRQAAVRRRQVVDRGHQRRYIVGIDGLSLPLVALTLLVTPLCIIYSWNHFPEPHNPKAFLILILVLHTGMLGTFVAQDLILFFVFFEVVLLPMYFMIGVWGGEERQYAVDQVLPLHPVRLGADDRELPGPVLRHRRRDVLDGRARRAASPSRSVGRRPSLVAPRC